MLDQLSAAELDGAGAFPRAAGPVFEAAVADGANAGKRGRGPFGIHRGRSRTATPEPVSGFAAELARSRRYGRPLALIGIAAADETPQTAAAIRQFVRETDSVWTSAGCLFVLLPESDAGAAAVALARLRRECGRALAANIAVFPSDALTGSAILEIARGRRPRVVVEPPASHANALAADLAGGLKAAAGGA